MHSLIQSLNRFSEFWWTYVFHATWQAAAVIAFVLVVVSVFRRWPSPWRYGLLLIALIKCVFPPLLSTQVGLFHWVGPALEVRSVEQALAPDSLSPPVPLAAARADVSKRSHIEMGQNSSASEREARPDGFPPVSQSLRSGQASTSSGVSVLMTIDEMRGLSWKSCLLLVHVAGTIAILLWIGVSFARLVRIVRHAEIQKDGPLAAYLRRLASRWKLRGEFDLLITDHEIPPAACWLLRPKIVIPRRLIGSMSSEEINVILAHELAHHRRRDWVVNWVQLLVCAAWWFNPLVWWLDRLLKQTREECCDDALLGDGLTNSEVYSRTLVSVSKQMACADPVGTALGFSERLHPVGARIKRILDPALKRITGLQPGALIVIGLVAVVLLPGLRTRAGGTTEPSNPNHTIGVVQSIDGYRRSSVYISRTARDEDSGAVTDAAGRFTLTNLPDDQTAWFALGVAARKVGLFTLPAGKDKGEARVTLEYDQAELDGRVVDSRGNGWPDRAVELRLMTPRKEPFGLETYKTDRNGYFRVEQLPTARGFVIESRLSAAQPWRELIRLDADKIYYDAPAIRADGVSPRGNTTTARVRCGGRIVTEENKPVDGAEVSIHWRRVRTDADGRWSVLLPADITKFDIRVAHSDYISTNSAQFGREYPADRLHKGDLPIVMKKGLAAEGQVLDISGKPVPDAVIFSNRWGTYVNGRPAENGSSQRTDAEGRFHFNALPAGPIDLLVEADNHPLAILHAVITPGMRPLVARLTPGRSLSGRILNAAGQPVPGAKVHVSQWQSVFAAPLTSKATTDNDGRFTLDQLPAEGGFELSCRADGYMTTLTDALTPQDSPHEIRLQRPMTLQGQVIDADTGQPIRRFSILPAAGSPEPPHDLYFDPACTEQIDNAQGRFAHAYSDYVLQSSGFSTAIRIMADGYSAYQSPAFPIGDTVGPLTVKLKHGKPTVAGTVLTADGRPAANAEVAWVGPNTTALIVNGSMKTNFTARPQWATTTDADGRFTFTFDPVPKGRLIFITHETGYASLTPDEQHAGQPIRLTPWSRIEGTIKVGDGGASGTLVALVPVGEKHWNNLSRPPVRWMFNQAAGGDSRFVFDKVPAIPLRAGWRQPDGTLSHAVVTAPKPGQTTRVQIGGSGSTLQGALIKPDQLATAYFSREFVLGRYLSRVTVYPVQQADLPIDERTNYTAELEDGDRFHIYFVPSGEYEIKVQLYYPPIAYVGTWPIVAAAGTERFKVDGTQEGQTIELPPVKPRMLPVPRDGDTVPMLKGNTLDHQPWDLASLRGKYVVLDVWATWHKPSAELTPLRKRLDQRYANDQRIIFIGINCDYYPESARKYIQEQAIPWKQVALENWGEEIPVLQSLGVHEMPSFWLIDPNGKIVARDIPPGQLEQVIETTLGRGR